MPRTAILYICTGHYSLFWNGFFKTCERYFLPRHERHYFVFTDDEALIVRYKNHSHVHVCRQEKMGWPYDTLMRFHFFDRIRKHLQTFDYIFFFNANARFGARIGGEILPNPARGHTLTFLSHIILYEKARFTYERNPLSSAYIPQGEGDYYVWGALSGGTREAYLAMIATLKKRIDEDLAKNITAVWHDESHLNRYLLDIKNHAHILPLGYGIAYPYDRTMLPRKWHTREYGKIAFLEKALIYPNGHERLRAQGELDETMRASMQQYIDQFVYVRKEAKDTAREHVAMILKRKIRSQYPQLYAWICSIFNRGGG